MHHGHRSGTIVDTHTIIKFDTIIYKDDATGGRVYIVLHTGCEGKGKLSEMLCAMSIPKNTIAYIVDEPVAMNMSKHSRDKNQIMQCTIVHREHNSEFAQQPSEPSSGFFVLRKLMADGSGG
jgi:hypothetical protein